MVYNLNVLTVLENVRGITDVVIVDAFDGRIEIEDSVNQIYENENQKLFLQDKKISDIMVENNKLVIHIV